MDIIIKPPKRVPFYLKIGIWMAEKFTGKVLLPARLLAWCPKAAIGSGVLESLTAHGRDEREKRLLRLVRLQAALTAACPFCLDMNIFEYQQHGVTREELDALQMNFQNGYPPTISGREKLALEYSRLITLTPLSFPAEFTMELKAEFTDREIVMLATTASQVNYWARLVQALGIPPAGFTEKCQLP